MASTAPLADSLPHPTSLEEQQHHHENQQDEASSQSPHTASSPSSPESPLAEMVHHSARPRRARPQSIMAQNFSLDLDNIFQINDDIVTLNNNIDQKRHSVSLQAQELRALEAQLREMDERFPRSGTTLTPIPEPGPSSYSPIPPTELDYFVFPSTAPTTAPPPPQSSYSSSPSSESESACLSSSPSSSPFATSTSSRPSDRNKESDESTAHILSALKANLDPPAFDQEEEEDDDEEEEEEEVEDYQIIRKPRKQSVVLTLRANEAKRAALRKQLAP